MIGASVLAKHMSHDLEDRPDGTVRCLTCAHTLLLASSKPATPSHGRPGCFDCTDGFMGETETGEVIACLSCRPHLADMFARRDALEQQRNRLTAQRLLNPNPAMTGARA